MDAVPNNLKYVLDIKATHAANGYTSLAIGFKS